MSVSPVLQSRAAEMCRIAAEREYEFIKSHFLSPAEQIVFAKTALETDPFSAKRLFFYGGALGADRRRAVFVPSYFDADPFVSQADVLKRSREEHLAELLSAMAPDEDLGIVPILVKGSSYETLAHRHYMGSVLGLGLERDVVGDIAVLDEHSAVIFTDEKIAPFVMESLTSVGRDRVKCSPWRRSRDFEIPRKFETLHIAAGSDRADSVAASLSGSSRAEAKALCTSGSVEVNYTSPVEPDERVSPGDIVSVRGYGKFIIDSFDGSTRSGRLKLTVRRYL